MTHDEKCQLCGTALPLARSFVGKMVVPSALGALGIRKGTTIGEQIVYLCAGLAIGYAVDLAFKELTSGLCKECSAGKLRPT